ncbi:MAG TPA: XdhC family protein, partial [Candidatus Limnocylindrales bacterium]|nr:XdhC family protein [Candidatus Limnocylindrales bacterium]
MNELLGTYDAWRAEGVEVGRAVVLRTFGSSPRREGAVLLVAQEGRMIGSVSGGCVEAAAAAEVLRARETGRSRVIRYGISDEQAWGVGLACGGTIDVLVEPSVPDAVLRAARASLEGGARGGAVAILRLPAGGGVATHPELATAALGQPAFVSAGDLDVPLGADPLRSDPLEPELVSAARAALDSGRSQVVEVADGSVFIEAFPPSPRLVVVGATEVARHLVAFARGLGYATIVIDPRTAFAAPERFPDADALIDDWPEQAFGAVEVGPLDAVAVLSHDPKLDEPAIVDAFRRGARYVGAIGSAKT